MVFINAGYAMAYRAYAIRPYKWRKTKAPKTTSDIRKTMSDVEKIISDIIQTTSDLFFAHLQCIENQILILIMQIMCKQLSSCVLRKNGVCVRCSARRL